ncbi:M48 family metallopeptidase [Pseudocolwellia agarivorans]|uniref:M48 family metallopeptidase n=1 Tax=Pseudocolwellia agarivorans TaxID=1911682 RepID=UPI000984FA22|nr:SprT family zinc-dependent metalloprotease [Pseudocolwellia agarivorans]
MSINYKVIRSDKRKTIALQIKNNEVIVRAPKGVSPNFIQTLITNKTPWILNKLAAHRQHCAPVLPTYLPNSTILIYGLEKKLCIRYQRSKANNSINITENEVNLTLPLLVEKKQEDHSYLSKQVKKQLANWMKDQAENYLAYRLAELSKQLKITPASYQVKRYKARWGSCNNKHELSFNYLLIMAPTWVFDYVIVHELCHIKHLNHSVQFWGLVEKHMPHYKQADQWLKQHQTKMHW